MTVYMLKAITYNGTNMIVELFDTKDKADLACYEYRRRNLDFYFEVEEWVTE